MKKKLDVSEEKLGTGCVMIALLVFGGGMIIQIIDRIILLVTILGFGFLCYRIYIYDQRTGEITSWLERAFGFDKKSKLDKPEDDLLGLIPPDDSTILDELATLREELESVRREKEEYEQRSEKTTAEAIRQAANQASHNTKKQVLNDLYKGGEGTVNEGYSRSEDYEKRKFENNQKQREEQLGYQELELKTERRLLDQDQSILSFRSEVKDDLFDLRTQISQLGERMIRQEYEFKNALLQVMQKVSDLKSYFEEKVARLQIHMTEQLSACREMIVGLRAEYKEEMASTKLQFGQEVLRLDQQQGKIINRLETYHNNLKSLSLQVEKVKLEGQRSRMESRQMYERANTLFERGKLQLDSHSKELDLQLREIAVGKEGFANNVGRAKMMLDHHSHELKMSIKELGYEKMSVEAVRNDFSTRQQLEQTKNQTIRDGIAHQNQIMQERLSRGEQVAGLRHQLNMSQERLTSSEQRLGLLRQENSFIRRLHI